MTNGDPPQSVMFLEPIWKMRLQDIRDKDPRTFAKLVRYLMGYMHRRKLISIEDLERDITPASHQLRPVDEGDPNRPSPRGDRHELDVLNKRVLEYAQKLLTEGEINTIIHLAYKNEMIIELGRAADDSSVPFDEVVQKLNQYRHTFEGTEVLDMSDAIGTRVALIRRFISDQLEYINVAKHFLTTRKISFVVERIIAPNEGSGKVGGKAAGLILAEAIMEDAFQKGRISEMPTIPRTYYMRSDSILSFIKFNELEECFNIKYRNPREIHQEYPLIVKLFKNAIFPPKLLEGLTRVLEDFRDRPLVVRSSSLLEDRVGTAFSGKYKSLFLANQGSLETRLDDLTNAISEVYASTFCPDVMVYRREKGLLDFQEEMGILIQEVVGNRIGPYFFPAFAGVAFSQNEFRWSPRIRRDDGFVRMVAGIGTRAVDRTYDDYAFLMSPGQPNLRVNVRPEEIAYYSQQLIDVIDLQKGHFATIPIRDVFEQHMDDFPNLENIVSLYDGSGLRQPSGILLNEDPRNLCVTFEGLIARTRFARNMSDILSALAEATEVPVDLEFAADSESFWLLQCRAQSRSSELGEVTLPQNVPAENVIFSARRFVQNGIVEGIRYIVYIDPLDYENISEYRDLVAIGEAVGNLNRSLPPRQFVLMGPGRWGSRGDIKLGVKVTYFDINNTAMLIEVARKKGKYVPEVSFGTHFFQDLVEANIRYLPLYPDEENVRFNDTFLNGSPNSLADLLPEYARLQHVIRVLDVPAITGGHLMRIVMSGDREEALAYLPQS